MKQKAKWGLFEKLLAAALALCLAAAGVFLWLFSREAREYTTASDNYEQVREQYLGTIVPDTLPPDPTPAASGAGSLPQTAAPTPSPTLALEQDADEEALELMVILHNEAVAASRSGATTTPMPTPAPTPAPTGGDGARGGGADADGDGSQGSPAVAGGADGAGLPTDAAGSQGSPAVAGGADAAGLPTDAAGSQGSPAIAGGADTAGSPVDVTGSQGSPAVAGGVDGAGLPVDVTGSQGSPAVAGGADGAGSPADAVGSQGSPAVAGGADGAGAPVDVTGSQGSPAVAGGADGAGLPTDGAGSQGSPAIAGGADGAGLPVDAAGSQGSPAIAGGADAAGSQGSPAVAGGVDGAGLPTDGAGSQGSPVDAAGLPMDAAGSQGSPAVAGGADAAGLPTDAAGSQGSPAVAGGADAAGSPVDGAGSQGSPVDAAGSPAVAGAPADAAGSQGSPAAAGAPVDVTGSQGSPAVAGGADGSPVSASSAAPVESSSPTDPPPTATPTAEPPRVGKSVTEQVRYTVDFPGLMQTNDDVCAWLLQEDTAISYPVVQGRNNTDYLEHLYTGVKGLAGSIFADCGNSRYFVDMVTYLYGHNRKDGAMFSSLPKYMEQAYANAHPSFYLLTPYMDYRLDVFACVRLSVDDKDEWHTKYFDGKRAFDSFMEQVMQQSAIRTPVTPQWGDQLLALCTCTNDVHEERYVVYTRMRPIMYETDETVSIIRRELDTADTLTREIDVPGVGKMLYYATNDPLWAKMCYEGVGGTGRRMGSGGAGPCAMAMITAHMLDSQYLWWLNYYSGREEGHTFCTCSVNQYFCNRKHAQYRLQTPEEFLRYLPVAMASFASGNNQWHENSRKPGTGTEATFMKRVCDIFGLYFEANRERDAVLKMLERGGMVVAVCGYDSSGTRHYVVFAAKDDTYIYILDPYYVEEYPENALSGVEVMEPGLLRARIEDWELLRTGACYLIKQWPY